MAGCAPGGGSDNTSANDNVASNENDNTPQGGVTWSRAFDGNYTGALTSIWGADENNIFAIGGQPTQCEVYHYDGTEWRAMTVPDGEMILAGVFGFSASDVWAVGEGGGVIHYNGNTWTALDAGTTEDLWSVWGTSSTDLWIVGGETLDSGPPIILHYDGSTFSQATLPEDDRGATALFGVYGVGDTVFAVGSLGLVLRLDTTSGTWSQVDAGAAANQDFLGIHGTDANHFVAVGGRAPSGPRIAVYDGVSWDTFEPPVGVGLSAVFTGSDGTTLVGGPSGFVAEFDPESRILTTQTSGASDNIRGIWGPASVMDTYLVVGGNFSFPFTGIAVLRTMGAENRTGEQPDVNEDGLSDAPLTEDGTRPDEVTPPNGNDNIDQPGDAELSFGVTGTDGSFQEIAEGGNIQLVFFVQDQLYYFNPVVRITGFPSDAANKFVSYTSEITFVSSGQVISEFAGSRPLGAAAGQAGALDMRASYYTDEALTPEQIVGQTIEITVTVTYEGSTPPATGTITQTMFVDSVLEL